MLCWVSHMPLTCVCVCVIDCFDSVSSCILLQKMLSEMQVENQQRLKDREQELKDLKKVMEVMKVGQQNFVALHQRSKCIPHCVQWRTETSSLSPRSVLQTGCTTTQSRCCRSCSAQWSVCRSCWRRCWIRPACRRWARLRRWPTVWRLKSRC